MAGGNLSYGLKSKANKAVVKQTKKNQSDLVFNVWRETLNKSTNGNGVWPKKRLFV